MAHEPVNSCFMYKNTKTTNLRLGLQAQLQAQARLIEQLNRKNEKLVKENVMLKREMQKLKQKTGGMSRRAGEEEKAGSERSGEGEEGSRKREEEREDDREEERRTEGRQEEEGRRKGGEEEGEQRERMDKNGEYLDHDKHMEVVDFLLKLSGDSEGEEGWSFSDKKSLHIGTMNNIIDDNQYNFTLSQSLETISYIEKDLLFLFSENASILNTVNILSSDYDQTWRDIDVGSIHP
ncbi:hypothetical protein BDB01DRAFT_839880 [Pilobolus umbonatus]|nr:hypothetical protein BDB01DRAFT_839880 [Pilobolus umbonatus]